MKYAANPTTTANMKDFKQNVRPSVKLYFNSATSQILYTILDTIEAAGTKDIEVNWFYDADEEDMFTYFDILFDKITIILTLP